MSSTIDQLDMQSHVAVAAIRDQFAAARAEVAVWEPRPFPGVTRRPAHPPTTIGTGRIPYLDEIPRPQPWLR